MKCCFCDNDICLPDPIGIDDIPDEFKLCYECQINDIILHKQVYYSHVSFQYIYEIKINTTKFDESKTSYKNDIFFVKYYCEKNHKKTMSVNTNLFYSNYYSYYVKYIYVFDVTRKINNNEFSKNYPNLNDIEFLNSIEYIGKNNFKGCKNFKKNLILPDELEIIKKDSFNEISAENLFIPNNCIEMNNCFNNCLNLKEVYFEKFDIIDYNNCFNNCSKLNNLEFVTSNVKIICNNLKKFTNLNKKNYELNKYLKSIFYFILCHNKKSFKLSKEIIDLIFFKYY